jgi:hypothetical protein
MESSMTDPKAAIAANGPLNGPVKILRVEVKTANGRVSHTVPRDEPFAVEVSLASSVELPKFQCFMGVSAREAQVFIKRGSLKRQVFAAGEKCFRFTIPAMFLRPGFYEIGAGGNNRDRHEWIWCQNAASFEVVGHWKDDDDESEGGLVQLPDVDPAALEHKL